MEGYSKYAGDLCACILYIFTYVRVVLTSLRSTILSKHVFRLGRLASSDNS
jgi:hypothetical protein